ncbi:PRC-barrel domain containing protein [Mesorhizobium sp. B2-7-3]|uniref:PRC-barrel domain-containing protein n=1 Tax=Mesorhizobium sp. B2-7-3 TaxID=2589907 RepID=UPI001129F4F1|nr:PRC-barrel domain-containing protein [Mesorhizobium sp. B2-7-3]TPJ14367.1 PRC-barrel domain containing protein [Mesorhizobium sp. B2-7-3]
MVRTILATTALAAFVSASNLAYAAQTATTQQAQTVSGHLASNIIGKKVYNGTGDNADNVGSVDDLLIGDNGAVDSVIVGVGGFLGMGEKDVAIPYNTVKWAEKDGNRWLVISATSDDLKAKANFDRKSYDTTSANSAAVKQDSNNDTSMAAAPTETTTAPATTAAIGATDKASLTPIDPGKIRTQELVGTTVYGANDANVGEIGDVVLTKDGKVDAVIVDVGGFLGMGEKEVAVGMDKLSFMKDQNGNKYLYTNFTKDQLKAQPAYDKSTWADNRDNQRMTVQ